MYTASHFVSILQGVEIVKVIYFHAADDIIMINSAVHERFACLKDMPILYSDPENL
jgi:hypothetical protein